MINSANMDITLDLATSEIGPFKPFSGEFMTKIFLDTGYQEWPYTPLGSGGFIEYKGKRYLVTNYHVVKGIPENQRLTTLKALNGSNKFIKLLSGKYDPDNDVAAFEVSKDTVTGKSFITEALIEKSPNEHLEQCNAVFLHGYPSENIEIDNEKKIIDMITLPYATFADYIGYNIRLNASSRGTDENGKTVNIPSFPGMSGSLAYCYYPDEKITPFKVLGLLTLGNKDAGHMWLTPFSDLSKLIDKV